MPKTTYEEALADYKLWKDAERALATGASYTIAGRSVTRIGNDVIQANLRKYGRIVDEFENGGKKRSRMRGITTFDR